METLINKTDKGEFITYIPLQLGEDGKVRIFEKSIKGSDGVEKTVKFLKGEASNTKIDKALQIVSPEFIKKIKSTIKGINVFVEHEHHLEKTAGYISDVGGDIDTLEVITALEDENENPLVKSIINKIKHGTKIFYSIAGKTTKATKEFVKDVGAEVTTLVDGEIWEVSLTALPEGNVNFVEPIMKSFKDFLKETKERSLTNADIVNATENTIIKALDEIVQRSGLEQDMYDMFWAFRDVVYRITRDEDLTPAEKKTKIISISDEYAEKVESLSTEIVELSDIIESELS